MHQSLGYGRYVLSFSPTKNSFFVEKHFWGPKKMKQKQLSSDPRDLSHELRAAPERVVAPGMRKTDGWRPISRPFWIRFGDFGFPAALAHFFQAKLKLGPHFPAKCAKTVGLLLFFKPPGILQRIQLIQLIKRKRSQAVQNRPWVPHAGGQDDGS